MSMRVCCVTTVLAALALRCAAEPSWRERERPRTPAEHAPARRDHHQRPLHDLFKPERHRAPAPQPPPPAFYTERRRSHAFSKRDPQIPPQIASQMMLRASRSRRPYDVPQIGESFA